MILHHIYKILFCLSCLLIPTLLLAAAPPTGLGLVATNLMDPVTILANFIGAMAMVIGISFLFGSFFKYMQHRVNPLACPISTVVVLLVMGLMLICLPLAYKLTATGMQVHL